MKNLLFYILIFRLSCSFFDHYLKISGEIWVTGFVITSILYLLKYKMHWYKWLLIILFLLTLLISFINSHNINITVTDSIKLTEIVIVLILSSEKKIIIDFTCFVTKHLRLIICQILIIEVVLLLNLTQWNKSNGSFQGPFNHPHSLAYNQILLVIICISLFYFYKNKKYIYLTFFPIVVISLTGARTPFLFLILFIFLHLKMKRILLVIVMLFFIYLMIPINQIPIFSKFLRSEDAPADISSGRAEFWNIDINHFLNSNLFTKLFGNGIDFPYLLHFQKYHGYMIWSHNDFLHLLLSLGIVGMTLYLLFILKHITIVKKVKTRIIYGLIFMDTAFFNGIYPYPDFSCAIIFISTIFLLKENVEGD
jgi:O-Antigen ligase